MTSVSTPTGTNSGAQLGDTITDQIIQTAVTLGETAIYTEVPFLAVPGIKQLFEMLVNWIVGYISSQLQLMVSFTIIDFQISAETSDFNKALVALKAAQATGNSNAISQALATFQIATQNLVHSDGSASPK